MRVANSWIRKSRSRSNSPSAKPLPPTTTTLTGSFDEAILPPITGNNNHSSNSNSKRISFGSSSVQDVMMDPRETIDNVVIKPRVFDKENSPENDSTTRLGISKMDRNTRLSLSKGTPFWRLGEASPAALLQTAHTDTTTTSSEIEEREDDASPSESSRSSSSLATPSYQEGKTFWMQFLEPEEQASQFTGATPTGASGAPIWRSRRTSTGTHCTPLGTTVQKTLTSGSPLSEASLASEGALRDANDISFYEDHPATMPPTSEATSESNALQFKEDEDETQANAVETEEREDVPVTTPTTITRQKSNDNGGGATVSKVQSARKLFEQKAEKEIASDKHRLDQLKPKSSLFSPPASKSSNVKKTVASLWERPVQQKEAISPKKPSMSPKRTKPKHSPINSKPHPGFGKAYGAWYRAGLMKQKFELDSPASEESLEAPKMLTDLDDDDDVDEETEIKEAKAEVVANALKLARSSLGSASDKEMLESAKEAGTPRQYVSPRAGSTPEGERAFVNILQQWRNHVDTRPGQDTSVGDEQPGSNVDDIFPWSDNSPSHSMLKRIQTFDKDDFDFVRASDSKDEIEEEEVDGAPTTNRGPQIVDSDMYEDGKYDEASRALVILENNDTYQIVVGDSTSLDVNEEGLKIRNVELVTSNAREKQLTNYQPCECSGSIFSGNDELISFFLPQMGMACTCGKQLSRVFMKPDDPMALENILRPWQVEFCKSFGIHRGEQLVKARHRSAAILAKALRQWRKKEGMTNFKTSSCGMAIDIWAKTCKVYVRSIRKQLSAGKDLLDRRPEEVLHEIHQFLGDLPSAPERERDLNVVHIEAESEMEV